MQHRLLLLTALGVLLFTTQCRSKAKEKNNEQLSKGEQVSAVAPANKDVVLKATNLVSEKSGSQLDAFLMYRSKQELIDNIDEAHLTHSEEWFDEGTVKKEVSCVYKGTNNELHFLWEANGPKIMWSDTAAQWSYQGIRCGTTLKELNAINGAPLSFYGFGWDGSGTVVLEEGKISEMGIELALVSSDDCPDGERLTGDIVFNSAKLNADVLEQLYVGHISIKLSAVKNNGNASLNVSIDQLTPIVLLGTEPFWSLRFDEKHIRFTPNMDEEVILIKYAAIDKSDETIMISALYDTTEYTVKVTKEACSDGMSDHVYPYSAKITNSEGGIWQGCGRIEEPSIKSAYNDLPASYQQQMKSL